MKISAFTLLSSIFFFANIALAAPSIGITNSELNQSTSILTVDADLSDFAHSGSASDYFVTVQLDNNAEGEFFQTFLQPSEFNGVPVTSLPDTSCSGIVTPTLIVLNASVNTQDDTVSIEARVCAFSDADVSDWSVSAGLFNPSTGSNVSTTSALQSLIPASSIIAFDSFDQVKLSLDDGNGSLEIEATVSDLAFEVSDEIEVSASLANSDNNEGSTADATATAVDADSASASAAALDCSSVSEPTLAIENVSIVADGASKKVTIKANACKFTHGIAVQNAQAWSVVVGLVAGSQSGSSQSAVSEFKFTSSSLVAQLDQQIAAIDAEVASINSTIASHNARINSYNKSISSRLKKIATNKRQIKNYQRAIKNLRKKIRRIKGRARILLSKKIRSYNKRIRTNRRRINAELRHIKNLRKSINNYRNAISSLRSKINQLNAQKAQLVQQRADLIAQRDEAAS